jgi:hypothetical protein
MATPLDYVMGLGELGATLGTGAVSGLVGAPYGLYKGITSGKYGTPEAVKIAQQQAADFMARNTYQPRGQVAQEALQGLGGLLTESKLPPVMPEAMLFGSIPKQAYAAQAERTGMAAERALAPVVTRTMERGGLPAQLLGDLSQGSIRPMDVWHGSPYGPFNKFDPSKARTGEGNASYGEGAYLAQARGTGESYREMLSAGKQTGGLLSSGKMSDQIAANTLEMYKTPSKAIEALKSGLTPNLTNEARQATNDAIDALKNINQNSGFLYKVDLPDEAIPKMLDWDKPLSQQTPEVRQALEKVGYQVDKTKVSEFDDALLNALVNDGPTTLPKQPLDLSGEAIYTKLKQSFANNERLNAERDALIGKYQKEGMSWSDAVRSMSKEDRSNFVDIANKIESQKNAGLMASEELQKQGITGIRYLDQMSRGAGDGTSNFVVFPQYQDLLTIKEINDQPVQGLLGR